MLIRVIFTTFQVMYVSHDSHSITRTLQQWELERRGNKDNRRRWNRGRQVFFLTFWASSRNKEATTTQTRSSTGPSTQELFLAPNWRPVDAKYFTAGSHIRPAPSMSTWNPPSGAISSTCSCMSLSVVFCDISSGELRAAILANFSTILFKDCSFSAVTCYQPKLLGVS